MLYLILGIIMIAISFKYNKNKIVSLCWVALMFSMMAFSGDVNPDKEIYLLRFAGGDSDDTSVIELLFAGSMALYRNIGLNWFSLQVTIALGFAVMMYFMATRYSEKPNYTFILYYFTGLFMDIVQLRNTFGLIFLIPGLIFLTKKGWKWDLISAALIILAGLCHGIFYIYLLALLVKYIKTKWLALGMLAIVFIVYGVYLLNLDAKLIKLAGQIYPRLEEYYLVKGINSNRFTWYSGKCLFLLFGGEAILYYAYKTTEEKNKEFIAILMKLSLICAIGFPLLIYSADFYRIQRNILFIYAIGFTYVRFPKKTESDIALYKWNQSIYNLGVILFIVGFIYLFYVNSLDFNTVVLPIFKDQLFF